MTTLRRRTNSEREIEARTVKFEQYSSENRRNFYIPPSDMACRDRTGEFMSVVKNKVS